MCLATPVKVKEINNKNALLDDGRRVNISLITAPKKGDWLLCHANLAINKLNAKEAQEILKLNNKCFHTEVK